MFNLNHIKLFDAQALEDASPYPDLIAAIAEGFQVPPTVPERSHHSVSEQVTLLSMPSWMTEEFIGHKLVNVGLDNARYGLNTINGLYLLFDAKTGLPLAILDAGALTNRRTAAVSACGGDILARKDVKSFLMVGTGALAHEFLQAHSVVRDYDQMYVWGRDFEKAKTLSTELAECGLAVSPLTDLEQAVRSADVISCATTSTVPLIKGAWLKDGVHLDLTGAFKPHMAECDGDAILNSKLYVDNHAGALSEAGEIVQAIKSNVIDASHILGDLTGLIKNDVKGRESDSDITLFKSVGTAISDYAIAKLVYTRLIK